MSKYLISLILLSVISMGVSAQRITRQYNNVSFSAALKDLNARQDKYVINFVYDELEDFKVTKNIKNESVPDAIMKRVSKKYLAPSIYSYPYWRLKSNIRFYKGVFCLFGHPHETSG